MSYQREFTDTIDVALVGAGSHGYRNILPSLHYLPVRLRAICDTHFSLAQKTAAEYGVRAYPSTRELYQHETLDAVLLSVSPALHPELACQAFEAGVHVWMEKPPAMSSREIETMIQARGAQICAVGFKKAFMPATQKAIEIFSDPAFQPLSSILAEYSISVPEGGEAILRERKFTGWLANGCHPLSLLLAVGGNATRALTHRGRQGDSVVILAFENGVTGTLHGGIGAGAAQPAERYVFHGKGCTLVIENNWRVTFRRSGPFEYGRDTTYLPPGLEHGALVWEPQNGLATLENQALFTQGFYHELRAFCDQVLTGQRSHLGSLEFAWHVMQVYEAALISDGDWIPLLSRAHSP